MWSKEGKAGKNSWCEDTGKQSKETDQTMLVVMRDILDSGFISRPS